MPHQCCSADRTRRTVDRSLCGSDSRSRRGARSRRGNRHVAHRASTANEPHLCIPRSHCRHTQMGREGGCRSSARLFTYQSEDKPGLVAELSCSVRAFALTLPWPGRAIVHAGRFYWDIVISGLDRDIRYCPSNCASMSKPLSSGVWWECSVQGKFSPGP